MNLTVGTALQNGKYLLGSILGQGELSITLQATQAYLNQTVVLKTLRPELQGQTNIAALKQRFIEESRRFAQCQHPGLVRVVDLFVESGLPFAAMDFVAGQSLSNLVQSQGPLSEAQAIQYIRQAGSALSVIHRNGLFHQNVNPDNLIRPRGSDVVVLVDYGIVHQTVKGTEDAQTVEDCYAAIEQFQPQAKPSASTDIYALAGTLYFLLTGKKPVAAPLREHTSLLSPRQLKPQLSPVVEAAILSGLNMNAQSRPQTVAAWFAQFPGNEPLPPVDEFSTQPSTSSTTVQIPSQQAVNSNGSKTVPNAVPATSQLPVSQSIQPQRAVAAPSVKRSRFPRAIVATAAISGAIGLGLGLALRFSAASGIGPRIFHTQQSFPPLNDWPGSAKPVDTPPVPLPPPPPVKQNPEPSLRFKSTPSPPPISPSPELRPSNEPTPEATPTPKVSVPEISPSTPSPIPQETRSPQSVPPPETQPSVPANPQASPSTRQK